MDLQAGSAAFITGGASGMGLAIGREMAGRGVKVILADIDAARVQDAADGLASEGAEVLAMPLDVRDEAAWAAAAEQAWAWSGGVDVLCNCAGVVFIGAMADQSPEIWRLSQDINATGPYLGIRAFLPRMLARDTPARIVNVASLAALWGESKLAAYTASKFALLGLSEALQLELARTKVGVSIIFPGPTRTNLGASTRRVSEGLGLAVNAPRRPAPPAGQEPHGMDPAFVARRVVQAICDEEVYVVTHADWLPMLQVRFQALEQAFGVSADEAYCEAPGTVAKLTERLRQGLASAP